MQRVDLNRAVGKQHADNLRAYMQLEQLRAQAHIFDEEPVVLKYRSKTKPVHKYRNGSK